jgi:hypothetical protein
MFTARWLAREERAIIINVSKAIDDRAKVGAKGEELINKGCCACLECAVSIVVIINGRIC